MRHRADAVLTHRHCTMSMPLGPPVAALLGANQWGPVTAVDLIASRWGYVAGACTTKHIGTLCDPHGEARQSMEFTLFYKGELKGRNSATPEDKQRIRREIHRQMAQLWKLEPLAGQNEFVSVAESQEGVNRINVIERLGAFTFAPLISNKLWLAAKLQITLLRPEYPGNIFHNRGDIDNQLKTLLDALSMPQQLNQLPIGDSPRENESPFYCLLQDDSLVTSVTVNTDRLLVGPQAESNREVVVFIQVKTLVTRPAVAVLGFL